VRKGDTKRKKSVHRELKEGLNYTGPHPRLTDGGTKNKQRIRGWVNGYAN